jgi:hypothetical protein
MALSTKLNLSTKLLWSYCMFNISGSLNDTVADEAALLDIYKSSIPPEFDADFIELQKEIKLEWDKATHRSGLRHRLARNAMQGNYSRCMFEDAVMSLAEEHGLEVGIFDSAGGSSHIKISTSDAVITFHTLGDSEDNLSRFTEYKKALARNNPKRSGQRFNKGKNGYFQQGSFFFDDDIGLPKLLPEGVFSDNRLYFTICVPRIFHQRNNIFLIVPHREYSDSIVEFNYLEVRDSLLVNTEIKLYAENIIESKRISLKSMEENVILPKKIDLGDSKEEKGT